MKHRDNEALPGWVTASAAVGSVAALVALGAVVATQWWAPADASVELNPTRANCKEASLAPQSALADACRDNGWTIRKRLVVGPRGVVQGSGLPHCRNEDGSGQRAACSWNFSPTEDPDGNGKGAAYWVGVHDHIHYVWADNPLTPHRREAGWHWSTGPERVHAGVPFTCITREDFDLADGVTARCPG